MEEVSKYKNRIMGILILGVLFWIIFGFLSRLGIFWFGIDYGFELIVRRVYAVFGLTILILSVILSIIMTIIYRHHFPKLNEQIVKGNAQYEELIRFKKIGFWLIMFVVLLQTIVFLLPYYIFILTDHLTYDFGALNTISIVILGTGLVIFLIPIKKKSNQKKEREEDK